MPNILFISRLDFTGGGPAQKRHRLLIRSVVAAGFGATLVNPQRRWVHDEPFRALILPRAFDRFSLRIVAPLWTVYAVLKNAGDADAIFCFDRNMPSMLVALIARTLFRLPLLHEVTEHPEEVAQPGPFGRATVAFFRRIFVPRLVGVSVISGALERLLLSWGPHLDVATIPAVAETPHIDNVARLNGEASGFTFLYAGSLGEQKDGVLSLVTAFTKASRRIEASRLRILGSGSAGEKAELERRIRALGVGERVSVGAPVAQSELPMHLAAADALVLCRPLSRQAEYGLPTKLAEYLAIGKPVITTITSDVGRYLRNRQSAILVPPGDQDAFSDAMIAAAEDAEMCRDVGERGREVFRKHFDANVVGPAFTRWIHDVLGRIGR